MDAQIVVRKFRHPILPQRLQIDRRLLLPWPICGRHYFCFRKLIRGREIDSRCSGMRGLGLRFELGDADHLR